MRGDRRPRGMILSDAEIRRCVRNQAEGEAHRDTLIAEVVSLGNYPEIALSRAEVMYRSGRLIHPELLKQL